MLGILWIIGSEIKLMGNKTCKYLYVFVCLKASQFCTSVVMAHRHFKCLIFFQTTGLQLPLYLHQVILPAWKALVEKRP